MFHAIHLALTFPGTARNLECLEFKCGDKDGEERRSEDQREWREGRLSDTKESDHEPLYEP